MKCTIIHGLAYKGLLRYSSNVTLHVHACLEQATHIPPVCITRILSLRNAWNIRESMYIAYSGFVSSVNIILICEEKSSFHAL